MYARMKCVRQVSLRSSPHHRYAAHDYVSSLAVGERGRILATVHGELTWELSSSSGAGEPRAVAKAPDILLTSNQAI